MPPHAILPIVAAVLMLQATPPAAAQDDGSLGGSRQSLVSTHCSRCHAIAAAAQHHREGAAVPQRWDAIRSICWREALAEGLMTGHIPTCQNSFSRSATSRDPRLPATIQEPGVQQPSNRVIK